MHTKDQDHRHYLLGNRDMYTFDYEEFGVKGVGKHRNTIINMDEYIDHSLDPELHTECCMGLAKTEDYKMGMVYGSMIPDKDICWSEILSNLSKYDPTGQHRSAIEELIATTPESILYSALYKYSYFAMGATIPWFFALYLKKGDFTKKTDNIESWTPAAQHFPKLTEYIRSLPFKAIGRVLFFTTYPNCGVSIHRDSIVAEHKDHNLNLFFTSGRPSFIWDEIKKEKIYLDKNAKSYFFNNRDYHGVDPEPVFRYTLRIDGTFTDELQEKLGLVDGYTWNWNYER